MNTRKAIYPEIGMRFGLLTVTSTQETKKNGLYFWQCSCDCGSKLLIWNHNLLSGNTKACRCATKKRLQEVCTTHGMSKTRPWEIWTDMRRRCEDKRRADYSRYGGRGITVCPEWSDFSVFWKDMGPSYHEPLQLDRKNNNEGYSKANCRWVSRVEQANNKRNNRMIEFNGKMKSLATWCRDLQINYTRTLGRLDRGWNSIRAFDPRDMRLTNSKQENKIIL